MDEHITKLVNQAIPELGIDKPILAARLKGNSLELFLYGGEQLVFTLPALSKDEAPPEGGEPEGGAAEEKPDKPKTKATKKPAKKPKG